MEDAIKKMRIDWAEGDAKRDAGIDLFNTCTVLKALDFTAA